MSKVPLTLLTVSAVGRGEGGGDMVVEARAKARVYGQRPGQVWGTVGERDKRLKVWNGDVVGG